MPGVAQVQPVARGQGLLMLGSRPVVPALLESWSPAPFNSYRLQVGHPPAADDEVALDLSTSLAQRIRLGDTVGVQGLQSGTFRDQGGTMIAQVSLIGT